MTQAAEKMELAGYLEHRLRPISEEMAASGAEHVLLCYVPAAGQMKVVSNASPAQRAELMRRMGRKLLDEADTISAQLDAALILPGSVQ